LSVAYIATYIPLLRASILLRYYVRTTATFAQYSPVYDALQGFQFLDDLLKGGGSGF
jgi:hypothetical protein